MFTSQKNLHSFHIPVMGIGFTVDTPLKVAHLGLDSVISLVDDILLEKLRKMYCHKTEQPYEEITEERKDFRSHRITSYLNLINTLSERKFKELKNLSKGISENLKQYIDRSLYFFCSMAFFMILSARSPVDFK